MDRTNSSAIAPAVPTVDILGIPFSTMTLEETVQYCQTMIESGQPHHMVTANPEIVMMAQENQEFRNIIKKAQLITCDGTGVVWATQYTEFPAQERVTGYDVTLRLFDLCERDGYSVYFVGAKPAVIERAVVNVQKKWPKLTIAGYHHGYFGPGDEEKICDEIMEKKPSILFVALGAPNQEFWISKYKELLNVPLAIGVGGSFDVISGTVNRAPMLWQKLRIEWLYRLIQQPSRWRRMLLLPKFMIAVWKAKK
ncbi:hypothetical protein BHU72_00090 [Desulfuribacillus stibiiarsenatis]|uniref:N-acetylglucosaminyldiphosphoundecaprenol N-acetyl-beta-D-mannosaminyltransferase n=1 Tax=Desulfuribacillus stibiiarsenatis TaxID=1390249 RepID=A0A1E5L9T7_9FIRM|nr:WecB/TagA/CpsF family glycosyltransferase [Desulfuribacillus stibiiarsenatis]OEH86713.1 hypothetical protein BHU72_00090 [Desulfuribacillus stibiiarsenatis]